MSELIQNRKNETRFRWQLLATASAIALLGYTTQAVAQSDEPLVWVELGGQLSRVDVGQETYSPEIMDDRPSIFAPSANYEKLPHESVDESGKLSFRPTDSDWVFSAGVRYGRSVSKVDVNQQTFPQPFYATFVSGTHVFPFFYHGPIAGKFASTQAKTDESHAILDFQAGKDVGLGLFGGSSQVNFGVRFAQFNNKSDITLNSDPDWHRRYKYVTFLPSVFPKFVHFKVWGGEGYHNHSAALQAQRNFHGIGPSLSWNGSSPFLGNREDGGLNFDYGVNAAVLFGRQRANTAHHTTENYHSQYMGYGQKGQHIDTKVTGAAHTRSRTLFVPNVGGFAGMTYRIHDFKISAGYRADFFLGAMDGGIDTRKSENVGFYGPFASVSVGIGG
jgi:hypothetical protein